MKNSFKICKYLDIPFQHISDKVLVQMRRGHSKQEAYDLIADLRANIPDMALRTTLMVGHPGEDEEAFNELLEFIKQVRFERLGVFAYSEEDGTYGAKNLKDAISDKEKQHRADAVMKLQSRISGELNQEKVGKTFRVIIDRKEGEFFIGRTQYDSPEVDGEVLIKSENSIEIGGFYEVVITSSDDYDLLAELA
jgi:ribosomal protein S12 methylthiotransferase